MLRKAWAWMVVGALAACDDGATSDGSGGTGGQGGSGAQAAGGGGSDGGSGGATGGDGGGGAGATGGGGAQGQAPTARVVSLSIPDSPDMAADCPIQGTLRGTGLGGLTALFPDGLDSLVQPDDMGDIVLVLFGRAVGFPGASIDFELLVGDYVNEEFLIDPRAYENGDPNGRPQLRFDDSTVDANGAFEGGPTRFDYTMPISGNIVTLRLVETVVQGAIAAAGDGFMVREGILAGYLTQENVVQLIDDMRALCNSAEPPATCPPLRNILNGMDSEETLVRLVGGYDVLWDGIQASDCDGDTCNAISVCAKFAMDPETIDGLAPPN